MSKSTAASHTNPGTQVTLDAILAIVVALGVILVCVSHLPREPEDQFRVLYIAGALYAIALAAWLLGRWNRQAAKWSTLLGIAVAANLATLWLRSPAGLTLIVVPVMLAVFLIDVRAAAALLFAETTLGALVPRLAGQGTSVFLVLVSFAGAWASLGVIWLLLRSNRQAWAETAHADDLLQESRDSKVELAQTLDDWTNANRQLAVANERVSALRIIAQDAEKTKTAFVANVSHEFRTPLNMIIGLVDLMVESPDLYAEDLPPELVTDLEIIHRSCVHLSNLVNDVLDLSQTEAGRLVLHRDTVDLADLVAESCDIVQPLIDKKGLRLGIEVAEDLPHVYCDRTRIRQVFLNLLSNAARFTDEGGITVSARKQEDKVVIGIHDTGPGISAEDAERIFEPFRQAAGTVPNRGGSGLGLSISEQFLKLHGGKLWLETEIGAGTTFYFDLPTGPSRSDPAPATSWLRSDWPWVERRFRTEATHLGEQPYRRRVVVCDGTAELSSILARYSDEVDVIGCTDPTQAIQEVQRNPAHIVIVNAKSEDVQSLTTMLRESLPHTPIVGCAIPSRLERAHKAGAANYLVKPVTRDALADTITEVGTPITRILVVDDDPDCLYLMPRLLRGIDQKLEITTASTGQDALRAIGDTRPDLIFLDIVLEDMEGWRFLDLKTKLEADRNTDETPVIIVSAQDPLDQPAATKFILATHPRGFSPGRLLRSSLQLSELLAYPDGAPDPEPG